MNVQNTLYSGEMTSHLLKYFLPNSVDLSREQIRQSLDFSKKSENFILAISNTENVQQINFKSFTYSMERKPEYILYSNKPEGVQYAMVLYKKEKVTGASKFLFFHKNISNQDGYLTIRISHPENKKIYFTGGIGGPDKDEIFVGQRMFEHYMANRSNGFVSTGTWQRSLFIKNNTVLGGIVDFYPISKTTEYDVSLYFTYSKQDIKPYSYNGVNNETYAYNEILKNVEIKNPFKTYNIRFGDRHLLENDDGILDGNYGVIHKYNLIFKRVGTYELHFVANGGAAGLAFLLDGKRYHLFSSKEQKIDDLIIEHPRIVQLETFPLPGSNYPVTITIKKKR